MRWDSLFDDLESQLEREISAEEIDLDAEQERVRLGQLSLRDRLVALQEVSASSLSLGVILSNGMRLQLAPVMIGRDWFSADVQQDLIAPRQCIIPIPAVSSLSLVPSQASASLAGGGTGEAATGHPALAARLGLAFVLRDLCRRRRSVEVLTAAAPLRGTIDRVGRDHLDLALHEPGSPRRASEVSELRLVPFATVLMVKL